MAAGKSCGQCAWFIRIKDWGGRRNGLCAAHDYNCHSDSAYAKKCPTFKRKKYKRIKCMLSTENKCKS